MNARQAVLVAALLAARTAVAQTEIPAASVPELVGPRTLALSAGVGLVTGNDALFVNPGALAARKRYSVEASYFVDRRGADNAARFFGTSIVDSVSSPVTAAVAYHRAAEGAYEGHVGHFALAFPIAERFWAGATAKFLWLDAPGDESRSVTSDVGVLWELSSFATIGAAAYNVIPVGHEAIAPFGVGAGLTLGSERGFQATADWRADFDRAALGGGADETKNRFGVGAEYLFRFIAARAGYQRDEVLDTDWWSAGLGLIRGTVALDVGYRQSLDESSARDIAVSLRVFLFD